MKTATYNIAYLEHFIAKLDRLKIKDKYTKEQMEIFTFFYENHTDGEQFRDMVSFYKMYEEFHEINNIKMERLEFVDFMKLSSGDY